MADDRLGIRVQVMGIGVPDAPLGQATEAIGDETRPVAAQKIPPQPIDRDLDDQSDIVRLGRRDGETVSAAAVTDAAKKALIMYRTSFGK
ncbi:hypothetical protein R3X27_22145 [Tropicimonas sp. TH_r6]|uniref:hypothetical protein n=1 Tax=Tropicimonas sp. TH_r6 TaxID=3082085 RepID=UPI002954EE8D|nr:hypothetical protein [Tropicimonas sp. TH_r6]MDV7145396.1 hypothetical protein [Tropicimonas sp. TH_r6]